MKWTIAIPVFGRSYLDHFLSVSLPRVLAALKGFDEDVHWLIHTDHTEEVMKLQANATLRNLRVMDVVSLDFAGFMKAHQEAYELAAEGDVLVLLCADNIPSANLFHYAKAKLAEGYLAVSLDGTRTCPAEPPRLGAGARELLEFACENQHPIIRECFYGWGRSNHPVNVYFTRDGESVVLRAMHLHPAVVVKRAGVRFTNSIDDDLLSEYPRDRIHVVQNGETALIEISPPEKTLGVKKKPFNVQDIYGMYSETANDLHRWYFEHPIRLAGDAECGDETVVDQVRKLWRGS